MMVKVANKLRFENKLKLIEGSMNRKLIKSCPPGFQLHESVMCGMYVTKY